MLTETRTIHLAVYNTLADWEIGHVTAFVNRPWWRPTDWPWQVRTVAETTDPITTIGGIRIVPDTTLAELDPNDSQMLVLVGANIWDQGGGTAFTDKARTFLDTGVPVAAICGATFGLARDGLLDDRAHTSSALAYLAPSGYRGAALYRDEPVVTDHDVITAGTANPIEFAKAIFERLDLFGDAPTAAWYRLFKNNEASGYFELSPA